MHGSSTFCIMGAVLKRTAVGHIFVQVKPELLAISGVGSLLSGRHAGQQRNVMRSCVLSGFGGRGTV